MATAKKTTKKATTKKAKKKAAKNTTRKAYKPDLAAEKPKVGDHPQRDIAARIETMAGMGLTMAQIAAVEGNRPSVRQIETHYLWHYQKGIHSANLAVAQSLFKKATGDGPAAVAAAIFWMKARARWSTMDTVQVQAEVRNLGDPNAPKLADLKKLSRQDLLDLERIAKRLCPDEAKEPKLPSITTTGSSRRVEEA